LDVAKVEEKASKKRPTPVLKIAGLTFEGPPAVVAQLVLVGLIAAIVVLLKPAFHWSPMWLSAALWLAFVIYWSVAAKNSAPVKRSEAASSRKLHSAFSNGALVLAFWRVPGLDS
jgi:hypothetical protein